MSPDPESTSLRPQPLPAGSHLRERVETLGGMLADQLNLVLSGLPRRVVGPQALGRVLGITTVTASRLLKAIGQNDPVATLQLVPGPNPLKRIVESAEANGAPESDCREALATIASFDELIRLEAGDRGALKAMLSAWLPEERKEFEAQRRQSIFKAMSELDGVSSELELNSLILHPGGDPEKIDIVNIKSELGIDRIRPDAVVQFGTYRLLSSESANTPEQRDRIERPRLPTNLDGEPALDGLHSVRLDEFCNAPPAPLDARRFGTYVQYSLGPTGFGPSSKVDLVIAEVNRNELPNQKANRTKAPYYFTIPEMATRRLVFDLIVHEDVYPGSSPELVAYDTAGRGPAAAGDPARALNLRHVSETVESLGSDLKRLRLLEFPRYGEMRGHVLDKLGWSQETFRSYRVTISYPLVGTQITLAFFE